MKWRHNDSNKVTVLSKHIQFKTYIDEYRKEYFNEGDILDWEIYEQRLFTDVGTLIHEVVLNYKVLIWAVWNNFPTDNHEKISPQ